MTKVAVVQLVSTENVDDNLESAAKWIAAAKADGAEFITLPENFYLMGKEEEDKLTAREPFGHGPIQSFLADQARQHQIWLLGGSTPMACNAPSKMRSASLLYNPKGELAARYDKIHLFDVCVDNAEESYLESSTFEAGEEMVVVETPFANIGLSICYDLRFPELYRNMHAKGVNLITTPAAFTYTTGERHWESLLRTRAVENLCYVLASNQGGTHINGRDTWGHSMIISPWGEILACIESGPGYALAELDMESLYTLRKNFPALEHRKLDYTL